MSPACTVPGCSRAPKLLLRLGLCEHHQAALRRMCRGKHRLPYAKVAVREAGRLTATGRAGPGPTVAAYMCSLCASWHVGHQSHPVAAIAAAITVRSALTAEELNRLISAWRPHSRGRRTIAGPHPIAVKGAP